MKRSFLSLMVLALIALMTLAVMPTQQTVSADDHEKGDESLHAAMEKMGGLYGKVRRQARKAEDNADTAEKLAELIAVTSKAKGMIPKTATTDDMKLKYRVLMNELIVAFAKAENAALTGDQDELKAQVKAAGDAKADGHAAFIPDDE